MPLGTKLSIFLAFRGTQLLLLTHQTLGHCFQGPYFMLCNALDATTEEMVDKITPDLAPAICTHGVECFERQVISIIGGPFSDRHLSVHTQTGGVISENGGIGWRTPYDCFTVMFAHMYLRKLCR